MIKLTKLNGTEIYMNPDLMGNMECGPHTLIQMTTGEKVIVKESPEQVIEKIVEFKKKIFKDLNKI
jgi:flagellar protein FlbD